jgi:predicted DNA-binding transcriptional regulator AlpA
MNASLKNTLLQKLPKKITIQPMEIFIMNKLLTAKELSEKLNLSISKLAIDRMKERGIPFIKWKGQGQRGAVRYPMSEVQAFMENNMKAKA